MKFRPQGLPTLTGRLLAAFRALWFGLFLAAVASATFGQLHDFRASLRSDSVIYSLGLRWSASGERLGVPISDEAVRAGFRDGQALIAANGRRVPGGLAARDAALGVLSGPEGERVVLRTQDPDGTVLDRVVTRGAGHVQVAFAGSGLSIQSRQITLSLVKLAHAAVMMAAAVLLFRRRGGDPVAALLSLAFLVWTVSNSSVSATWLDSLTGVMVLDRVRFGLFVVAMMLAPAGSFRPRWTAYAAVATVFVAVVGIAEAVGLLSSAIYLPAAIGCVAIAVVALNRRYRQLPPGVQRQQIKWAALGLAAGLTLAVSSRVGNVVFAPVSGPIGLYNIVVRAAVFDIGTMLMALGVLVSQLRYRLYDADAAISRSAAYAAITVALVAIFAGSESVIQTLSQQYVGGNAGAVSGGIAAALAAALIAPLHGRVTGWTEERFQRALATLKQDLPRLVGDLRETATLATLAATVVDRIETAVRAARLVVVFDGAVVAARHVEADAVAAWTVNWTPSEHGGLDCQIDDALFPLRVPLCVEDVGTIGWILLGPRPDGSFYGTDEREALAEVAGPVARACHIIRKREQRDAAGAHEAKRAAASIARLQQRLTNLEARVQLATAGDASDRSAAKRSRRTNF